MIYIDRLIDEDIIRLLFQDNLIALEGESIMNSYCTETLEAVKSKYPWEGEFIQAVNEVFLSLGALIEKESVCREGKILDRIVEPERIYIFRVPWRDGKGNIQVSTG